MDYGDNRLLFNINKPNHSFYGEAAHPTIHHAMGYRHTSPRNELRGYGIYRLIN